MKIVCPECSATFSNEIYMNFRMEESMVFQMFGRKSAEKAFQKESFTMLENGRLVCNSCQCFFDKNNNILRHSPFLEEC